MEMEANRNIVEMLNQSSILTRVQPAESSGGNSVGTETAVVQAEEAAAGLKVAELMAALELHAAAPDKWPASILAQRYGLDDVDAVANALEHVRPYRVVEAENKFIGIAIEPEGQNERESEPPQPSLAMREAEADELFAQAKRDGANPPRAHS